MIHHAEHAGNLVHDPPRPLVGRPERLARGEPAPTREDLERHFTANWKPAAFGDKTTEATFERRVGRLLDNFWDGEVSSLGEAIAEELDFTLVIETADGTPPVRIYGGIDQQSREAAGPVGQLAVRPAHG